MPDDTDELRINQMLLYIAPDDGLRIVPCPLCDGSAVSARAVWVYEHGCAFGHYDTEEDPCPECEGSGVALVDVAAIELEDMEDAYGS